MEGATEVIRSRANPFFKRLVQLKERGADDLALIEGVRLLEEALRAGVTIREVAAATRVQESPRGPALLRTLKERGVPVRLLEDRLLDAVSETETSQGVLALAERPTFAEEAPFAGVPLLVVAVGIQNPGNLGGLLRTAEAAGATGALLTEGTVDPYSWKALRGSMGSAFRLPHTEGLSAEHAIDLLHLRGVRTVAAYATASVRYDEADLRGPVAFLFGNEGAGLSQAVIRGTDQRVSIPMRGSVESLNVGVAAGILLFEAARQRRLGR
jgi:RNA methyltransferase, TrmH family